LKKSYSFTMVRDEPGATGTTRGPGSGCGAVAGENRSAALFGTSAACVATHPSDLAVALSARDGELDILGPSGLRRVALGDFYRLPQDTSDRDTNLAPGELITGIFVPRTDMTGTYLKIRDRASFEFAVVSVAACLRVENGVITQASLAAGGVAPMPWRFATAEAALVGRAPTKAIFTEAAALAVEGARPLAQNGFKITLLRRAVLRALTYNRAAGRNPPPHWFTTLRDAPRNGPVRDAVKTLADQALMETAA